MSQFTKNFILKIVTKLSKIRIGLGSKIQDSENSIPEPGATKASDPGSCSATLARIFSNYCMYIGKSIKVGRTLKSILCWGTLEGTKVVFTTNLCQNEGKGSGNGHVS